MELQRYGAAEGITLPRSKPLDQQISPASIVDFIKRIEEDELELHSLMIVRNGHVISEGWWSPYRSEDSHLLNSLKSFTSTAIGIAAHEGLLSLDDTVISFFPEETTPAIEENMATLQIRHLLSMSTGHAADTTPAMQQSDNWARTFLGNPIVHEPGTHFLYNTGATYMLSAILTRATGEKLLDYLIVGWLVSLFALTIAVSGPTLPILFSGINRKKVMLLVLGVFVLGNIVSLFTSNFTVLLIARIIPAVFHPIYCSLAFTVAASSVSKEQAPKAVSKVFIGVSAGMVARVPIASYLDSTFSYDMVMAFFAIVNAIVFIATFLFVPSIPVEERLSYGSQFSILKKPVLWVYIATVILLNSAVFGVYSYGCRISENSNEYVSEYNKRDFIHLRWS